MAEKDLIRAALFGDGSQDGALISNLLIGLKGHNQYDNMKAILQKLTGINVGLNDKHHFHIYLRPPEALSIGGTPTQNLLADEPSASQLGSAILSSTAQADVQGLLTYAQTVIETGDEFMLAIDIPYVPLQETPIVLVQATSSSPDAGGAGQVGINWKPDYIMTQCREVSSEGDPRSAERFIDPAGELSYYFLKHFNHEFAPASVSTKLLVGPKHGKISSAILGEDAEWPMYHYAPEPGFVGKDQVVFQADYRGKRYKIVVNLMVPIVTDEDSPLCPKIRLIKVVSQPAPEFSSGDLGPVTVSISALDYNALAQTIGQSITLDDNAASYGWFVDTTPDQNEEFLPTSNLNEWVAKAGSAAEGKMDMLTVLLHESGHALGLEHSAGSHDLMAATLQPGVRRTLSSADLDELWKLLGNAGTTQDPSDPTNPQFPLGMSVLAFLARTRSSRSDTVSASLGLGNQPGAGAGASQGTRTCARQCQRPRANSL